LRIQRLAKILWIGSMMESSLVHVKEANNVFDNVPRISIR
jgi:hypothetical protein